MNELRWGYFNARRHLSPRKTILKEGDITVKVILTPKRGDLQPP